MNMKKILTLILIPFILSYSQSNNPLGGYREIYTHTLNGSATFRIQAEGIIWGSPLNDFPITTTFCNSTLIESNVIIPYNYNGYIYGWDNIVLNCSGTNQPPFFGYSIYKISFDGKNKFFYLNTRDCDYNGGNYANNDIYLLYDDNNNVLYIQNANFTYDIVNNGQIKNIWDIPNKNTRPNESNTVSLQNFWYNCLVMLDNPGFPTIVWGPHPTFLPISGYKIYRKVVPYGQGAGSPLSFSLLTSVSSSTFSFIDYEYTKGGQYYNVYYYVKAYYNTNLSDWTNIVGTSVNNNNYKINNSVDNEAVCFNLSQNYPNPFNPITKIKYSLPEQDFVQLTVYNAFGQEIQILLNEKKRNGTI
jgi:hypothetical protein